MKNLVFIFIILSSICFAQSDSTKAKIDSKITIYKTAIQKNQKMISERQQQIKRIQGEIDRLRIKNIQMIGAIKGLAELKKCLPDSCKY